MEKKFSNLHSGEEACLYTIQNGGLTAKITNLGATLVQLWVPDASGTVQDVVLGYDDAQAYVDTTAFWGAPWAAMPTELPAPASRWTEKSVF